MKTYATAFDVPCPECGGTGRVCIDKKWLVQNRSCHICKGSGRRTKIVWWGTCRHCLWCKPESETLSWCKRPPAEIIARLSVRGWCDDYHFVREERKWEPDDVPEWAWIVQCGEDQWQSETCGSCGWRRKLPGIDSGPFLLCNPRITWVSKVTDPACREWKPRHAALRGSGKGPPTATETIARREFVLSSEQCQKLRESLSDELPPGTVTLLDPASTKTYPSQTVLYWPNRIGKATMARLVEDARTEGYHRGFVAGWHCHTMTNELPEEYWCDKCHWFHPAIAPDSDGKGRLAWCADPGYEHTITSGINLGCDAWRPKSTDAVSILKRRHITTEEREQSLRDERKYDEGYQQGYLDAKTEDNPPTLS